MEYPNGSMLSDGLLQCHRCAHMLRKPNIRPQWIVVANAWGFPPRHAVLLCGPCKAALQSSKSLMRCEPWPC